MSKSVIVTMPRLTGMRIRHGDDARPHCDARHRPAVEDSSPTTDNEERAAMPEPDNVHRNASPGPESSHPATIQHPAHDRGGHLYFATTASTRPQCIVTPRIRSAPCITTCAWHALPKLPLVSRRMLFLSLSPWIPARSPQAQELPAAGARWRGNQGHGRYRR